MVIKSGKNPVTRKLAHFAKQRVRGDIPLSRICESVPWRKSLWKIVLKDKSIENRTLSQIRAVPSRLSSDICPPKAILQRAKKALINTAPIIHPPPERHARVISLRNRERNAFMSSLRINVGFWFAHPEGEWANV